MSAEVDRRRPRGYKSHRSKAEVEAEAIEVLRLKVLGWSDAAICAELGMARQTVADRLRHAIRTHGAIRVEEYREIAKQRYEAAMVRLGPMIEEGSLDAIRLWLDANARYARLVGAEAPAQMALEVTEVTEQERALRGLLDQAQREQKAREASLAEEVDECVTAPGR